MPTALDALFDQLNRDLFDGTLPKHRVRRCASRTGERGFIDAQECTIWICTTQATRETLLHEMCHIGTPGHGRPFRNKLRRLARGGEAWARAERVYYVRRELWLRAEQWIALWRCAQEMKEASPTGMR
jgi:hypothetical protein